MPLKANDYHNHLKLKTKAQICYFLLFLSVFFNKISVTKPEEDIYHFRIISRFLLPYLGKGIYPKSYKNKNIKAYIGPTYIRTHHSASLQIVHHPYQSHRA